MYCGAYTIRKMSTALGSPGQMCVLGVLTFSLVQTTRFTRNNKMSKRWRPPGQSGKILDSLTDFNLATDNITMIVIITLKWKTSNLISSTLIKLFVEWIYGHLFSQVLTECLPTYKANRGEYSYDCLIVWTPVFNDRIWIIFI